jgi:hypothetical protein
VRAAIGTHFKVLIKLYILADKLEDLESVNVILDSIIRFSDESNEIPNDHLKKDVYNLTPPSSPLRTLLRDLMIYEMRYD